MERARIILELLAKEAPADYNKALKAARGTPYKRALLDQAVGEELVQHLPKHLIDLRKELDSHLNHMVVNSHSAKEGIFIMEVIRTLPPPFPSNAPQEGLPASVPTTDQPIIPTKDQVPFKPFIIQPTEGWDLVLIISMKQEITEIDGAANRIEEAIDQSIPEAESVRRIGLSKHGIEITNERTLRLFDRGTAYDLALIIRTKPGRINSELIKSALREMSEVAEVRFVKLWETGINVWVRNAPNEPDTFELHLGS